MNFKIRTMIDPKKKIILDADIIIHFCKGESACMAYCKYNKDVIGSSNLKDITKYCQDNEITYLTTMDFINTAFENKMLTEAECDEFIYDVSSKGSRLPCSTLEMYRNSLN